MDANHNVTNWIGADASPTTSGWTLQSNIYTIPSGVAYAALYATNWQPTSPAVIRVDDGFLIDNRSSLQVVQNLDYLPFGELNSSDSAVTSHKFTGDERDGETGLDHTLFRKYSSTLGRWTTPDPASLSVASPAFPQSWNRYSYVLNNPLSFSDPSGLWCVWQDGTHDDDEADGGIGADACTAAGGLWDGTDGLTGCDTNWSCTFGDGSAINLSDVCGDSFGCYLTIGSASACGGGICAQSSAPTPLDDALTPFAQTIFGQLSAEVAPLNKLSDCAGSAAASQIPFGHRLLRIPNEPSSPVSTTLDGADKAHATLDFFSENKSPAMTAWTLKKVGLPILSESFRQGAAKVVPYVAPLKPLLKYGGAALSAGSFVYETTACYNKQ